MKQTSDSRLVADGTKREREECLLEVSVAVEEHPLIFEKGCFTRERARKRFSDYRPGRRPALGEILTHRLRMLLTADRPVAVVINLHMLGSPGQRDREVGGEAEADRRAQAL